MKLNRYLMILAPMVAAFSAASLAQVPTNQVRLGAPVYHGSGCAAGSVSAQLSPDSQSLSILFGSFQAQAGGSSGKASDQKICEARIPISVPAGYSFSISKMNYRGYNHIPSTATATLQLQSSFADTSLPTYHQNFSEASDGNFSLDDSSLLASAWSACGETVKLKINAVISVQTNPQNEQVLFTLDNADLTSGVVYQLRWRACSP
jgi:hypothetical protein